MHNQKKGQNEGCQREGKQEREGCRFSYGWADLSALRLNSKPYIGTLARFNESYPLEDYLRAFKVLEKPLALTKQARHNANLRFIHKTSL
jgi:hypothetical protein